MTVTTSNLKPMPVLIVKRWQLCDTAYSIILCRSSSSMGGRYKTPERYNSSSMGGPTSKSTLSREMESSRSDRNLHKNLLILKTLSNFEVLNSRVERRFQRLFHRLDNTQVWTASLVSIKSIMWSKMLSGNSLILSLSSLGRNNSSFIFTTNFPSSLSICYFYILKRK